MPTQLLPLCDRLDIIDKIMPCGRTNDNDFVADFVDVEIVDEIIARVADPLKYRSLVAF